MNGTTVQTGNLKYTVALSTSDPTDPTIIACGKFDYTFGILTRLDKNLGKLQVKAKIQTEISFENFQNFISYFFVDMEWNTVTSRECAGLVLNTEEDYVTTAIENLPNGFEVISLNSTGGEIYFAFQMVRLDFA